MRTRAGLIQAALDRVHDEIDKRLLPSRRGDHHCKKDKDRGLCDASIIGTLQIRSFEEKQKVPLPRSASDISQSADSFASRLCSKFKGSWPCVDGHRECIPDVLGHQRLFLHKTMIGLKKMEGTKFPTEAHRQYMARQREKTGYVLEGHSGV